MIFILYSSVNRRFNDRLMENYIERINVIYYNMHILICVSFKIKWYILQMISLSDVRARARTCACVCLTVCVSYVYSRGVTTCIDMWILGSHVPLPLKRASHIKKYSLYP